MQPKPLLLIAFVAIYSTISAQDYNPYKSIGKKGKIITAYGDRFVEVFDYDSIQRVGSILLNIRTGRIVKLLDADKVFGKYLDNSSSSRWYSVDPKATKFPQYSPYVFVADNPIRYNDPDGQELVDPNGKHIAVHFNKDGSLKFSKNANADFVKLANGMAKTEVGLKMLHTMNDSKTKISMVIDKTTVERTSDGIRAGGTDPMISQTTINGKPVGEKYISSAKITVYEAAVNKTFEEGNGQMNIYGKTFDNKVFSTDDIMTSVAVHEGTHVTDRASSSSLNPNSTKEQTEKKPYQNQLLYLKQLEESRQ